MNSDNRPVPIPAPSAQVTAPVRPRVIGTAPVPIEIAEPAGDFSLRELQRVLHARRRVILYAAALGLAAALVYNFVSPSIYRAAAAIQIDREEPNIAKLDGELRQVPEQPDYLETQYKVLKSRALARRVIEKLRLDRLAEFRVRLDSDAEKPEASGGETDAAFDQSAVSARIPPSAILDEYLDHLGVHPGKGTRLVDVSFESIDPKLAARVVNTLADEYIDHNLEAKWNATQKASGWLREQLATLEQQLEISESELLDYARRHSILFVEERKNITTEKLAQLEQALTRAETERIHEQSRTMLLEDESRTGQALPGSLTSRGYEDLKATLTELRREHSRLLVTFAPEYPSVRRARRQIVELEKALDEEESRILDGVREGYALAEQRERLLLQQVERQRALVNRLGDDFIQYNILKRDAETNRTLYEGLLQRLKEAGVSAGLRASNIAVLDRAEIPELPHRPRKLLNAALGLFSGLLGGIILAFFKEHMNTVVRTPEQVEQMTGLSLLAVIPRGRSQSAEKVVVRRIEAPAPAALKTVAVSAQGSAAAAALEPTTPEFQWDPEAALSEAYRTLRSSILLGCDDSMRRILVTSAQPQEGKTTVSLNLACSLAQLGRNVLLVDADLRRPNCARQLGIKARRGLTDYLQGLAEIEEVITETPIEGLHLAAAGRAHGPASDLLYSPRLAALLDAAADRFEHVIVDSPPSLVLSDARTISQMVDGVVLVVSDQTESAALLRTKQTFDETGVRLLGFVMNRVNLDNLDYGYYRDYGYSYRYSDERET